MNNTPPVRANAVVLKQLLNFILRGMINRHDLETGVEAKARTFSAVSHLSAMLFAQLSHAIGLNDACDWMRLKSGVLARFGVTPPSKNGLSNANKDRNAEFAQKLFWSVLGHLQHASPDFAAGRKSKGLLRRFKVRIHAVNSTVIQLVANCMDWAKHRRRKHKGMKLRHVEAWVEVDGEWWVMVFITNNTEWSPRSVCDVNGSQAHKVK